MPIDHYPYISTNKQDLHCVIYAGSMDEKEEQEQLIQIKPDSSELDTIFENALASTGFGKFHIILLLVCGWSVASDSVEVQCVSFVVPVACDLHLTTAQKGYLNAIIFVGMMVGGYGLGGMADIKGRRFMLMWSMLINGLFGLISSFADSFYMFLIMRFLSGIGVGAAMPVVFSYFTEFLPKEKRGPMIGMLATFWMCGNIITSGIGWAVIPHKIGGYIAGIHYSSWRVFVAICAFPSLSAWLLIFLMPESPKFLQLKGKYAEAQKILMKMHRINHESGTPVPSELDTFKEDCIRASLSNDPDPERKEKKLLMQRDSEQCMFGKCFGNIYRIVVKVLKSTGKLFVRPYTGRTFILIVIWFTLSFGFYGLWMWFPEIFQRIENGENSCGHTGNSNVNHTKSNLTCEEKVLKGTFIYYENFLVALSNLPGNIFTILLINKVGRRQMMCLSMVLSGGAVFLFWLVNSRTLMIVVSCLFSCISVAGWNALDVISMEQYPTELRSTAFGMHAGVGRVAAILGNFTFGLLVDVHCVIPLMLISVLLVTGGLTALRLPRQDQSTLN